MRVPITNSADEFTKEYALQLETKYSSAIIVAIDDGSIQEINPSLILISLSDSSEKSEEPTETPIDSNEISMAPSTQPSPVDGQTRRPVLRGSPEPTIDSTKAPTASVMPESSSPSNADPTIEDDITLSPTVDGNTTDCTDENDACMEYTDSGECSRTKCAFWASENECETNPNYMSLNCQKSCGICGDGNSTTIEELCSDLNDRCDEWALQNECVNNAAYMEINCRDACGYCGCEDKNVDCAERSEDPFAMGTCMKTKCEEWTSEGECDTNVNYMDVFCRKSCDRCGVLPDTSCRDQDERCAGWATEGECTANPAYMEQKCADSCGLC